MCWLNGMPGAGLGHDRRERGFADLKRVAPWAVAVRFDQVEGVEEDAPVSEPLGGSRRAYTVPATRRSDVSEKRFEKRFFVMGIISLARPPLRYATGGRSPMARFVPPLSPLFHPAKRP